MKKIILKILIGLCLFLFTSFWVIYWYLGEAASLHFDLPKMTEQVKKGNKIPPQYEAFLDRLIPVENKQWSVYYEKWFCLISGSPRYPRREGAYKYSYSEDILDMLKNDKDFGEWTNLFDRKYIFSLGIESSLTAQEIRNFHFMNNEVYLPDVESGKFILCKGVEDVSKVHFNKALNALNRSEMIEVFVLTDREGAFYAKNKIQLEQRVKFWEDRLKGK